MKELFGKMSDGTEIYAPRYGYLRTPVCLFILLRLLQLHERIA